MHFTQHSFHLTFSTYPCHYISHETEAEMGSGGKGPGMLEICLQSSKRCLQQTSSTLLLKLWSFNLISSTIKPRHEKTNAEFTMENIQITGIWWHSGTTKSICSTLYKLFFWLVATSHPTTNPWHRCSKRNWIISPRIRPSESQPKTMVKLLKFKNLKGFRVI